MRESYALRRDIILSIIATILAQYLLPPDLVFPQLMLLFITIAITTIIGAKND